MARSLERVRAELPAGRRAKIERRAMELATLKGLRQAVERTQEELAARLGVGQDTISRLERRGDMLLSTLRRYVEGIGGELELVAKFPDRPPLMIKHLSAATKRSAVPKGRLHRAEKGANAGKGKTAPSPKKRTAA